ncbi:MAG: NifB/NifX family molybdenum-iron cluster-binding protein [Candidatus Cryosericum sp.]
MPRRQVDRRCGTYDEVRPSCSESERTLRVLGADEMEALRLSDLLELDQTEAARLMDVSQSTFHRILAGARRKVAASLVSGHTLTVARAWDADMNAILVHGRREQKTGGTKMVTRIALPTDDGTTLCQHFGRAHYYKVVEITDGKIVSTELRDKFAHVHGEEHHGESEPSHEEVHGRMADAAHGCNTIIAGGIGGGAMNALTASGYTVMQTDMSSLDEIVESYRAGTLVNLAGKVSCHHEGEAHGKC